MDRRRFSATKQAIIDVSNINPEPMLGSVVVNGANVTGNKVVPTPIGNPVHLFVANVYDGRGTIYIYQNGEYVAIDESVYPATTAEGDFFSYGSAKIYHMQELNPPYISRTATYIQTSSDWYYRKTV